MLRILFIGLGYVYLTHQKEYSMKSMFWVLYTAIVVVLCGIVYQASQIEDGLAITVSLLILIVTVSIGVDIHDGWYLHKYKDIYCKVKHKGVENIGEDIKTIKVGTKDSIVLFPNKDLKLKEDLVIRPSLNPWITNPHTRYYYSKFIKLIKNG